MITHNFLRCLFLSILFAFSGFVFADDPPTLTFRKYDQVIKVLNTKEILQSKGELSIVPVDNPTDSKIHIYEGISLTILLDQVFGGDWKTFDAVKFISADGYQPIIPTSRILANAGYISVHEKGRSGFIELPRKNGETVDPGPFYLVWENIKNTNSKNDEWLSWPWQITSIELTTFAREFPHSVPPKSAGILIQKGFQAFSQHCIKCHMVNGDGGKVGPELNSPVNVTEYWKEEELKQFIADPQIVRPNSKMLPFYRDTKNRQVIIEEVVAYLKAMKDHKMPQPNSQDK